MKYFVQPKDIKGTMYWEFFKGTWDADKNSWWNEDSLCINWTFYKEIEDLILKVNPAYDHYGETEITRSQWEQIEELALSKGGLSAAVVKEAEKWMKDTFNEQDVFTVLGL